MKFYITSVSSIHSLSGLELQWFSNEIHVVRDEIVYCLETGKRYPHQAEFIVQPGEVIVNDPRPAFADLTAEWQWMSGNDYQAAQEALAEGKIEDWRIWSEAAAFSSMIARIRLFQLIGNGEE